MIKICFFFIIPHFPTCQAALRGKQAIPTRFQDDLKEQDGQAGDMQGGLLLLPDLDGLLALVVVLLHGGLVHQAAWSRLPLCSLSQHLVVPVRTTRNYIISKRHYVLSWWRSEKCYNRQKLLKQNLSDILRGAMFKLEGTTFRPYGPTMAILDPKKAIFGLIWP